MAKKIYDWLRANDDFLVVSHVNPDGDATGSLLAINQLLKILGKKGRLVNEGSTPSRFLYLPDFGNIVNHSKDPLDKKYQYIICIDCADAFRVGKIAEVFLDTAEIVNIDHHPTNDHYGDLALVVPEASSTCEVIYDLVREVGIELTQQLATCLYTGYLTDTGGFRYSNTTPKVLRDASELVEAGAPPYEIAERALESISFEHVQLLSKSLSLLELSYAGKAAFLSLPMSVIVETGASKEDAEGLANYGRNIEGVEVAVLIRETDDGVKVSFRSKEFVDVSFIAKQLGGGGHVRAAGCSLNMGLVEAREHITPLVEAALNEAN